MSNRSKKNQTRGNQSAVSSESGNSTGQGDDEASESRRPGELDPVVRRHFRWGWWSLLFFLTLGIGLEAMHGFKVQWYVGEQNATRRLMWTLAHAHGTLMALIHLGFGASLYVVGKGRWFAIRSRFLSIATALVPLGFFLGGWSIHDGDPSLMILVVPIGAIFLFCAVLLTAMTTG